MKLIQRALVQSGIERDVSSKRGALPNFNNCLTAYKHDPNGHSVGYFRPDHLLA